MRFYTIAVVTIAISLCSNIVLCQVPENIAKVEKAQKAAYAITESTNGCPLADTDLFGWPKELIQVCEYSKPDTGLGHTRRALVYLLNIKPDIIATWIESACDKLPNKPATCFHTILKNGKMNSGLMFAISGNIIEDMDKPGVFRNYFFRNGMTTSFKRKINGGSEELTIEEQRVIALLPNEAALSIASGMTRFWRTTPDQFHKRFPEAHDLINLNTSVGRQNWLDLVRIEMLSALNGKHNRLLEAWLCSNSQTIFQTSCQPAR